MLSVLRGSERGHANHGWLDSHHTFSFADYYNPSRMDFRALRVINEDRVAPNKGFGTHGHRDMEIVSYVLDGALEHRDSMGTGSVITPGDVQRMSAGSGVMHSEFNASKTEQVHFLQIWLQPQERGIKPSYEQKRFSTEDKRARFRLIASPDGREGSVTIHTDAQLYATVLASGERATFDLQPKRGMWLHLAKRRARVGEHDLVAGDAVYTNDAQSITIEGVQDAEALLFDLA